MFRMKFFKWSIVKNEEIDPIIEKNNTLIATNAQLENRIREMEHNIRVCNQLLDASQNSVIQLSKHR